MNNASASSLLEIIKQNFHPSHIKESMINHRDLLLSVVIFFGVGFLTGFFLKKFSHYFAAFIVLLLILIGLDYVGLLTIKIDWVNVQATFGIKPVPVHGNHLEMLSDWVQENIFACMSYAIGFFVGLRLA